MNSITTVTQKGQVTVPLKIRKKLGIKPFSKVKIEAIDGFVKIIPTQDILDIAGTFVPKEKKAVLSARESFEKDYERF